MRSLCVLFCLRIFYVFTPMHSKITMQALISKDLLPYASAVIRNEQVSINVDGLDNTIYHVKEAITV